MSSFTCPPSVLHVGPARAERRSPGEGSARRAWPLASGADAWFPEPLILRAAQPGRCQPRQAPSGPTHRRRSAAGESRRPIGHGVRIGAGSSSRDARTVARARRSIVLALALLVVTTIPAMADGLGGSGPQGSAASGAPEPVAAIVHYVEPGDTLWSIARRIEPDGEVRPIVDALSRARGGLPLQPGEAIRWPLGSGL